MVVYVSMGPVFNIVPPVEERSVQRKHSDPLSPAAAIAASARAINPQKPRHNSTTSLVTDTTEDRPTDLSIVHRPRRDKASIVLGIQHRYGGALTAQGPSINASPP